MLALFFPMTSTLIGARVMDAITVTSATRATCVFGSKRVDVEASHQVPQSPHSDSPFPVEFRLLSGSVSLLRVPSTVNDSMDPNSDKTALRATLSFLWLLLNSVLIMTFITEAGVTTQTLVLFGMVLPMLAAGIRIGERPPRRLTGCRSDQFALPSVGSITLAC